MRTLYSCSLLSVAIGLGLSAAAPASAKGPFEGPYVGGYLGYSQTESGLKASSVTVSGLSADGITGGGYVGIESGLAAAPSLRVGIEADLGYSGGSGKLATATEAFKIAPDRTFGVSGLLGILASEKLQAYGKIGYIHTDFHTGAGSDGVDGYRFGAGVEYALQGDWTLRAEILRSEYHSFSAGGARFDPAQTSLTAGVRYSF
jgi:outer membrane immunogenic protein